MTMAVRRLVRAVDPRTVNRPTDRASPPVTTLTYTVLSASPFGWNVVSPATPWNPERASIPSLMAARASAGSQVPSIPAWRITSASIRMLS